MKKVIVFCLATILSGCSASEVDQRTDMEDINLSMPGGCTLKYMGSIRVAGTDHPSRIFVAKCGDTSTISDSHEIVEGKIIYTVTDVVVSNTKLGKR